MRVGAHALVCRGPDCASRGAQDVYTALALAVADAGLAETVTQTQTGCVGPVCGQGPVVCCYPTGAWYAPVAPGDAPEIVREDLEGGAPVARLVAARVGEGR
jgi:(2Fe-2S) ferredoxin